jgi:hypothetical protein
MHFLVRGRLGFKIICAHSVEFQLECHGWFKVPVYSVFSEVVSAAVSEEFWELAPERKSYVT